MLSAWVCWGFGNTSNINMQSTPTSSAAQSPLAGDPGSILRQVFGYDRFRGRQSEIIKAVTTGHNALVLMPTGGGKS
ncbi:MAG: hypothetical protein EA370_17035, partial [Wenzhouxiangella sp.]